MSLKEDAEMMQNRMIITNGRVLTMDMAIGDFERADILIVDGKIERIAPQIEPAGCEVIDAGGMIVLPGFVDCHRHMWQTQLRAITADWSLFDYSARIRSIYSSFYTPEDVYLGMYAGFLEAIHVGVTTIVDHCHIMNSSDHSDEAVRAFHDAKIRGILCYGLFGNPAPQDRITLKTFLSPEWHKDDIRRLRKNRFTSSEARVQLGVALTELEFFPMELTRSEIEFARSVNAARISSHVGLGAMSKHTALVKRLSKAGLLGKDLLFIHGSSLTDEELKILAASRCGVITTPETELQMGMGIPVFARVLAQGGLAGLGIDIVSNQSADMFTQMRLALQVQRALENESLAKKGIMPRTIRLSTRKILEMATIGGARAIGLDNVMGSITPGKWADLILIRTDTVNMVPINDPVGAVVLSANAGDIDTVLVAGEILKRKGELVGVDWPGIAEQLTKSRDRIRGGAERKGFEQGERVMADNVFPLDDRSALRAKVGGLILRMPLPFVHRAIINSLLEE
jgi:cytosine/adenosine deaminase-related metal-dependent hydrolase